MIAIIHSSKSLNNIFYYNENKVSEAVAKCLEVVNYPIDTEAITIHQKLSFLKKRIALNENVKVNSVHISLNFEEKENLPETLLKSIADSYMQQIGFGEQPYLVYQHFDAGHPHLHLVTTCIRSDGIRISLHNIGKDLSEKARKNIEQSFGLVIAEAASKQQYSLQPIDVSKLQYGKTPTKRAMQHILNKVLFSFKYSSLPELNALLKQYNMMADKGSETSRTFKNNGLLYRVLDEDGNKIGVPIKASAFYHKPTLKFLEQRFIENEKEKPVFKKKLQTKIDFALLNRKNYSLEKLKIELQGSAITMVLRQNKAGLVYGITYIDFTHKTVFNGSSLGKAYSAKGILERCENSTTQKIQTTLNNDKKENKQLGQNARSSTIIVKEEKEATPVSAININTSELVEALFRNEQGFDFLPYELRQEGKKKKKRKVLRKNL